jgi:hypothetical protein
MLPERLQNGTFTVSKRHDTATTHASGAKLQNTMTSVLETFLFQPHRQVPDLPS